MTKLRKEFGRRGMNEFWRFVMERTELLLTTELSPDRVRKYYVVWGCSQSDV